MNIKKGYCRIKFKNGEILFGKIEEISESSFLFLENKPIGKTIEVLLNEVESVIHVDEDDVPFYE